MILAYLKENSAFFIWIMVFIAVFSFSLIDYFFNSRNYQKEVFIYQNLSGKWETETHLMPRRLNRRTRIKSYIEELFNGPISFDLKPLLSRDIGSPRIFFMDNGVLVDIPRNFLYKDFRKYGSLADISNGLRKNLHFSFGDIGNIRVTVAGSEDIRQEILEKSTKK